MSIQEILSDKSIRPGDKSVLLGNLLTESPQLVNGLLETARISKEVDKANCIEALEHASLKNPGIITAEAFGFVVESLTAKAPRIKWESARVLANCSHLYAERLAEAIPDLLSNTEHPGTVVRWSAAFALASFIRLKTGLNEMLIPAAKAIIEREEKNSIRKIYIDALKKAGK